MSCRSSLHHFGRIRAIFNTLSSAMLEVHSLNLDDKTNLVNVTTLMQDYKRVRSIQRGHQVVKLSNKIALFIDLTDQNKCALALFFARLLRKPHKHIAHLGDKRLFPSQKDNSTAYPPKSFNGGQGSMAPHHACLLVITSNK